MERFTHEALRVAVSVVATGVNEIDTVLKCQLERFRMILGVSAISTKTQM